MFFDPNCRPPMARTIPKVLKHHGHERIDPYYWLRERESPEVMAYLNAENDFAECVMKPSASFREDLYQEIIGRVKQTDMSLPHKKDDYFYYRRFEEGKEYAVHCRRFQDMDAPEQVLLDGNELSKGYSFFNIGGLRISTNQSLLAYPVDTTGRRIYTIYFKDLETGEMLPDIIEDTAETLAWAGDNRTVFYTRQNKQTLRTDRVYRHVLGEDPATDQLVFFEEGEAYNCQVTRTLSKKFIFIVSHSSLSTEYRFLEAGNPEAEFTVVEPREPNHIYHVDHYRDKFYILSNEGAVNFRLLETPLTMPGKAYWREVIAHRADVLIEDFHTSQNFLVLSERSKGLPQLRILPWSGEGEHYIEFDEPVYTADLNVNPDFNTDLLRFSFESLTRPLSIFEYNMATRERILLKQQEILGDFDAARYSSERIWVTARDGTEIPVSLVHHRDTPLDGSAPLLMYGYGSYGITMDPTFSSSRLSLLDRGFIFAIAHVRGGSELGRQWYEAAKLLQKSHTFNDFIDCADYLVNHRYTQTDRLFAMGGSAGGMLMGVIINRRPDLFKGVVAQVPFVDCLTTMLDPTIPLTTFEYNEWGNPAEIETYDYILSYSPYDNIIPQDYPNLLIMTGLTDSQVQYWEPAKWTAKLRSTKTGDQLLLLKTNMDAGHTGSTGRFKQYEETAWYYTFLLGLAPQPKP